MRTATEIADSIDNAIALRGTHPGISWDADDLRLIAEHLRALPADVVRLVIAARVVAFEDQGPAALKELDEASEAFASRVPWRDGPDT